MILHISIRLNEMHSNTCFKLILSISTDIPSRWWLESYDIAETELFLSC
jgi:hypothetical protein